MIKSIYTLFSISILLLSGVSYADDYDSFLIQGHPLGDHAVIPNIGSASEPWIDSSEVRMKIENDERGDYSKSIDFRFRPRFKKEQTAAQSVFNLRKQQLQVNNQGAINQGMQSRYLTLIDLAELRAKAGFLEKRIELLQAESKLRQAGKAAPDKLQDVVLKIISAQSDLEFTRQNLSARNLILDGKKALRTSRMVSPTQIAKLLKQKKTSFVNSQKHSGMQKAAIDLEMASSQLGLAQAKNGLGVSVMELSYDDKDNASKSLMFGVQIPFGIKSDPAMREKLADHHEAKANLRFAKYNMHGNVQEKINILESLSTYWQAQQKLYDALNSGFDRLKDSNEAALILTLNQQKLSVDEDMAGIRYRMLRDYINLLHISGFLTDMPLRNWLRPGSPIMVVSDAR